MRIHAWETESHHPTSDGQFDHDNMTGVRLSVDLVISGPTESGSRTVSPPHCATTRSAGSSWTTAR